ncbi:regulator [Gilliamella sp. ESL0250]|uniref:regulator n=1 Tax=Gilliamella sp. ESL0250 TaxID=2705036 RepID=UPI001580C2D8|nr:regulator [Gilliamella sp. ESL0250]NUF49594.1 regulator [Gilliamella sp. ESL0250]
MTPRISIAISVPYVTVDEFARVSGMNPRTVKKYISESKLPIRKKQITGKYDRSITFINMVT